MDIIGELRIQAGNYNARSLSGREGELLNEAADEIERLRAEVRATEETCKMGYSQAYDMIATLRDRLEKQREGYENEIKGYEREGGQVDGPSLSTA